MNRESSVSEDGNYYGKYYIVGKNIPEGMYLVLSMDTKEGKLSCGGNAEPSGGAPIGVPRTRFRYQILVDNGDDKKGSYLELDNCMLIPVENKPAINPIPHEDITYKNRAAAAVDLLAVLLGKETEIERNHYSQPVYAQGDYIVGEDLPLGTYQIQCEIAGAISDGTVRNAGQILFVSIPASMITAGQDFLSTIRIWQNSGLEIYKVWYVGRRKAKSRYQRAGREYEWLHSI